MMLTKMEMIIMRVMIVMRSFDGKCSTLVPPGGNVEGDVAMICNIISIAMHLALTSVFVKESRSYISRNCFVLG